MQRSIGKAIPHAVTSYIRYQTSDNMSHLDIGRKAAYAINWITDGSTFSWMDSVKSLKTDPGILSEDESIKDLTNILHNIRDIYNPHIRESAALRLIPSYTYRRVRREA